MQSKYPVSGISLLIAENRGTNSITQFNTKDDDIRNIGNAYERFEDCILDIQAWIETAKKFGYENIWLQSHSLSTSKVAYYLHQVPNNQVTGVVLLSPSDMIGLINDPIGKADHDICIKQAREFIQNGQGDRLLEHDLWGCMRLSANTYVNFFDDGAKTAIYNYTSNLGWKVVNSINIPVIAFTGTKDDGIVPVIDAYKAMEILDAQLKNSPRKKTIVFEDAEHNFEGFGEMIADNVVNFINQ